MSIRYSHYHSGRSSVPEKSWAWNLYGPGMACFGDDGHPEQFPLSEPAPDQLLARVDCVGLCYSDIKLIHAGGKHPKLHGRDLSVRPARIGHEASLTVVKVGTDRKATYYPGQRLIVQPEFSHGGRRMTVGFDVPGCLTQYMLLGSRELDADGGACVLPLEGDLNYAAASLLEPWGTVLAAYTHRRRLQPKSGGRMWIVGRPGDQRNYQFSSGLQRPETIILSDAPESVLALTAKAGVNPKIQNGIATKALADFSVQLTNGKGFDDIILLDPRSAERVGSCLALLADDGVLNIVGENALDARVRVDIGRIHYDFIAVLGNPGPDISKSYGDARNRSELSPHGLAVIVGAGGPMGQMHLHRAIDLVDGPRIILASDSNQSRLNSISMRFSSMCKQRGRELIVYNPVKAERDIHDVVKGLTGDGADDVIVCVARAEVISAAAELLKPAGMMQFFAGVPRGTYVALDLTSIYLDGVQFTGTTGLSTQALEKARAHALADTRQVNRFVAAIGGMNSVAEALKALVESRYPGKIVIFPQLPDLPLLGLDELVNYFPDIASELGLNNLWTAEAEQALVETLWKPN